TTRGASDRFATPRVVERGGRASIDNRARPIQMRGRRGGRRRSRRLHVGYPRCLRGVARELNPSRWGRACGYLAARRRYSPRLGYAELQRHWWRFAPRRPADRLRATTAFVPPLAFRHRPPTPAVPAHVR